MKPSGNGWRLSKGGQSVSNHKTQRAAINAGRRAARKAGVELITYQRDGRVKSKAAFSPYEVGYFEDANSQKAIVERRIIVRPLPKSSSLNLKKLSAAVRDVFPQERGKWTIGHAAGRT